jgi:hypothetical protein
MYNSYLNKEQLDKYRNILQLVKKKSEELLEHRHMFDYVTHVGYAGMIRNQFLMAHSTYLDGKRVWRSYEDVDYILLNHLMEKVNAAYISYDVIRELSRTDPWRSYWNASKTNLFGKPVIKWTEEQKILVSYSKMYDSIFQNPECPGEAIIEDDDLLDGWMIKLRRDREADRKQTEVMQILGDRHQNDTEIFLPARNKEEASEIDKYNSPDAQRIKKQREQMIKHKGTVSETELPDVLVDRLNTR